MIADFPFALGIKTSYGVFWKTKADAIKQDGTNSDPILLRR